MACLRRGGMGVIFRRLFLVSKIFPIFADVSVS